MIEAGSRYREGGGVTGGVTGGVGEGEEEVEEDAELGVDKDETGTASRLLALLEAEEGATGGDTDDGGVGAGVSVGVGVG